MNCQRTPDPTKLAIRFTKKAAKPSLDRIGAKSEFVFVLTGTSTLSILLLNLAPKLKIMRTALYSMSAQIRGYLRLKLPKNATKGGEQCALQNIIQNVQRSKCNKPCKKTILNVK